MIQILYNFACVKHIPQFLISAPSSGSGKTSISAGLMEVLSKEGFKVQPFKCGPDYIDTKFHQKACNRASVNLDSFMATPEHIKEIYGRYSSDAEVVIVEGMMGLFDGYSRWKGSAAEIASIIGLPVILVVDAKSAAYSIAPLLKGFINFHDGVKISGVIFNKVGSLRHKKMLEEVCSDLDIPALGFIPKSEKMENDSRYLGLDFSNLKGREGIAEIIRENVDVERLLKITQRPLQKSTGTVERDPRKVLVARNEESFSFIYQEHLDNFKNVTFFNPEEEFEIPADTDLLYLPGGYPEKHLKELSKKTMKSVKEYAEKGGKILAECGGMIYLCNSILTDEGRVPLTGVLPYTVTSKKENRKLSLGYRSFTLNGVTFKGHEFHYTKFEEPQPKSIIEVFDARENKTETPVMRVKNTIASYTHLYWGEEDIFKIFQPDE